MVVMREVDTAFMILDVQDDRKEEISVDRNSFPDYLTTVTEKYVIIPESAKYGQDGWKMLLR